MVQANFTKPENEALQLLKAYDIDQPVIPVFDIAQKEGLEIKFFKSDGNEQLSQVSGFFDPESKTIYVNSTDPPQRQMFTVAHELGHFKLGHESNEYGVLLRFAVTIDKEPKEQEANCFAANLLVPKKMLEIIMKDYDLSKNDIPALSKFFGVSDDVIKYRLKWL